MEFNSVFDRAEHYDANIAFVQAQNAFINRVYGWMCGALALTGFVAAGIASDPELVKKIFSGSAAFMIIVIAQLAIVIGISAAINRISAAVAATGFILYAGLNGVIFSTLFLVYTQGSIAGTFFATSLTFGAMSVYGYVTKRDLTSIGNICFMGLIGLIIASVVNIFVASTMLYWITTYVGILIFVGLTAYDTQKIKKLSETAASGALDAETGKKYALLGALTLYLDFINLFLLLLRLFGRRR
jgi:hypothetical protein